MGAIIARYYGANNHRLWNVPLDNLVIGAFSVSPWRLSKLVSSFSSLEHLRVSSIVVWISRLSWLVLLWPLPITSVRGLLCSYDSQAHPLPIFSAVVKRLFRYLTITTFNMGVMAAAIATIAQGLSAVLCFIYIKTRQLLDSSDFVRDDELYMDCSAKDSAMDSCRPSWPIGSVMLQLSINALDHLILCANVRTTHLRVSTLPFAAIAAAMTTFTSQNFVSHWMQGDSSRKFRRSVRRLIRCTFLFL